MFVPLSDVRIFDFSWVFAGPICTKMLAIMGAEVIKVETATRAGGERNRRRSGSFDGVNFSKKGITLNLATERGRELGLQLAKISDVIVDNFSKGVMERFGLGYGQLRAVKPDVIVLSSSGLGRTGPESHHVAYGQTLQAYSGVTALIGNPGGEPLGFEGGGVWSDPVTGLTAAITVLGALRHCRRTGQGQFIDISMTEATMALLAEPLMDWFINGRDAKCVGNDDAIMAPHGCYRCKGDDKWVAIAIGSDEEWGAFCCALGNPDWTQDARFGDRYNRWLNRRELDRLVQEWAKDYTAQEVTELLQGVGVAVGPSLDTEEAVNDVHLRERGFFIDVEQPEVGVKPVMRPPWRLVLGDEELAGRYEPAPALGEHNRYVLGELLGLSSDEIDRLVEQGVVA